MTEEAATPGTPSHLFIWNSRNEAFRAAGFTGVSVGADAMCAGGMEPITGKVAWSDAGGWLWCRVHTDNLVRSGGDAR